MKKEPIPQIFMISRKDSYHSVLKFILRTFGMKVYKILPPTEEFNLMDAESADIIIADVEDANFGFKDCEIIEIVKGLFPDKKIIGITDNYNGEILNRVKQLGATGYIYRDCVDDELGETVQKIANGQPSYMVLTE